MTLMRSFREERLILISRSEIIKESIPKTETFELIIVLQFVNIQNELKSVIVINKKLSLTFWK